MEEWKEKYYNDMARDTQNKLNILNNMKEEDFVNKG